MRHTRFPVVVTAVAAISAGCLTATSYVLFAQAQEGMPSARRLGAMKTEYKRPPPKPTENRPLVELGRSLFWDPRISASGKTACASCHFPYLGWGTTDMKSRNDSGKLTSRRSQPLISIGHAEGPFGWDGRNATLEAQAKSSVATGSMSMRETETPDRKSVV